MRERAQQIESYTSEFPFLPAFPEQIRGVRQQFDSFIATQLATSPSFSYPEPGSVADINSVELSFPAEVIMMNGREVKVGEKGVLITNGQTMRAAHNAVVQNMDIVTIEFGNSDYVYRFGDGYGTVDSKDYGMDPPQKPYYEPSDSDYFVKPVLKPLYRRNMTVDDLINVRIILSDAQNQGEKGNVAVGMTYRYAEKTFLLESA